MEKEIKSEIIKIIEQLNIYAHEYYDNDNPSVSDAQYDALWDRLVYLEQETGIIMSNSPTQKVGGTVLDKLTKVTHSQPMLSCNKTTDIKDIDKFMNGHNVVGSYKMDGATIVLIFNNGQLTKALTRGSGIEGEDVTHTIINADNIPMIIPYKEYLEVRGEAVIPIKYYNEMNADNSLGHERNVCSGAIRQLDGNNTKDKHIHFYAFDLINWKNIKDKEIKTKVSSFEFLKEQGFDVVPYELILSDELIEDFISKFDRATYENFTDGYVFCYNDLAYGESLGITGHHPRNMMALKPAIEAYPSKFRGIEYNVTRTGIISLTAKFDPVEIDNTIIEKASVHNVDIFDAFKFGIGDDIEIIKSNMIIPQIYKNNTKSETYKLIDKCPVCGSPAEIRKEVNTNNLYCTNDNCPAKLISKFAYFVSKPAMNIEGLSEKTLEQFINAGILETYTDIYYLKDHKDDILKLEGWQEKSFNNLIESIENSRTTTLSRYITAMGIPNIGKSAANTIAKKFKGNIDDFLDVAATFEFSTLEDFGDKMEYNIHQWATEDHILDEGLLDELKFKQDIIEEIKNEFVKDKVFVVTGKFETMQRKDLEKLITDRGGKLTGSVSRNTDYLLTNETTGTTKYNKAKELGIPILNEEEFLKKVR